jgi:hypothetical protein
MYDGRWYAPLASWGASSVMRRRHANFQLSAATVTSGPCGTNPDAVSNKLKPLSTGLGGGELYKVLVGILLLGLVRTACRVVAVWGAAGQKAAAAAAASVRSAKKLLPQNHNRQPSLLPLRFILGYVLCWLACDIGQIQ